MKTITRALSQLTLIVAFLTPVILDAATYYVATNGNDAVSCTTAQNVAAPKRTISNAIGCLRAGDTLYIRAGTYNEGVYNTTLAGTTAQPITIAGYPGDARPVVRGPASLGIVPTFVMGWRASRAPYHLILRDFDIDGIDATQPSACVNLSGPNVTVDNLIIRNCGRDGIQAFSANLQIRNSQILNCGRIQPSWDFNAKGEGVYIAPDDKEDIANAIGGNVIFENNVVDGCRAGGGVIHFQKADNNIIRYNIVRNFGLDSPWPPPSNPPPGFENFGAGFGIGGATVFPGPPGPQNNQIYNNIIYNGHGTDSFGNPFARCFEFWGTGAGNAVFNNTCHNVDIGVIYLCLSNNQVYIRNNIFSSTRTETYVCGTNSGAYTNNLHNPNTSTTFVNAALGDFRLQSGSPAIDAGVAVPEVTRDFAGVPRPQGARFDIGAYEYSVGQSSAPSAPVNLQVVP